jgi:fatty acid desaturase
VYDSSRMHIGQNDFPDLSVSIGRYPRAASASHVRRFSKVSNWRSAGEIALQWIAVVLAGWAAIASGQWWAYPLAWLVIATRQQAMGVLLHEGAHRLLFTNRTVNDVVCDLFLAFPLGMSTTLYRDTHYRHHRFTNTDEDPDYVWQQHEPEFRWPKTRREAWWLLVQSALGINLYKATKVYLQWSPATNLFQPLSKAFPLQSRLLYVASSAAVFLVIIGTNTVIPLMLVYAVPGLTLVNLFNRIRATAEHIRTPGTHELNSTRTVIPTLWERLTVAPFGISYHLEHHLFPSVPGRQLAALHKVLMEDEEFCRRAHVTRAYTGVVRELMAPARRKQMEACER